MSSGRFAAFQDDDSDSDNPNEKNGEDDGLLIPSYEDLSSHRLDEETVLSAVYGPDFKKVDGAWGSPRLEVKVRPPDLDAEKIGTTLTLSVQLTKKYPYAIPSIDIKDVHGLSRSEQSALMRTLRGRASELAGVGSVMVCELVQVAEDYLLEHNIDPSMSAWEQMKAREAKEKADEQREQENVIESVSFENTLRSRTGQDEFGSQSENIRSFTAAADLERELARQTEALVDRRRKIQGNNIFDPSKEAESTTSTSLFGADEDDNKDDFSGYDDDSDEDGSLAPLFGSSRYKADFIELGVLGRGGGGEVVKVRNRLDRRVYAVKKIILESERGKFAKFGAVQNRKLRREVKTISRMTHKNIVRYYQAWQEGSGEGTISEDDGESLAKSTDSGSEKEKSSNDVSRQQHGENEKKEESDGWSVDSDSGTSGSSSSSPWPDEDTSSGFEKNTLQNQKLHRGSLVNLLEHENDHNFQVRIVPDYFIDLFVQPYPDCESHRILCSPDLVSRIFHITSAETRQNRAHQRLAQMVATLFGTIRQLRLITPRAINESCIYRYV